MTLRHGRTGVRAVVATAGAGARSAAAGLLDIEDVLARLRAGLSAAWHKEEEYGRLALWLPALAIAGVLLFFTADREPSLIAAGSALGGLAATAVAARRHAFGFTLSLALTAVAFGFFAASWREMRVAAPILSKPITAEVTGTVIMAEQQVRGMRVLLRVESFGRLKPQEQPLKLRVTVPKKYVLSAGDRVAIAARWRPPPAQVRPSGYDFARDAYFAQIGAVGSAVSSVKNLPAVQGKSFYSAFMEGVEQARAAVAGRIRAVLKGDAAAISMALVSGQRGEISDKTDDAVRIAGFSHVLSISGLHMALFAGAVFASLRLILVLIPGLALRWPVKSIAALAALASAFGYLLLSGADVPAQRSFVMIALIFIGICLGRSVITQRNLAVAALMVVILAPEAILGPSFQMSFAAVMALVAWYETRRGRQPGDVPVSFADKALHWGMNILIGAIVTTIIAGLATAPYAAFHFQRLALHSLAGNLLVTPIVGVIIMPAALVGLALLPFGFDGYAWQIMGFGVNLMIKVAFMVSSWPGADQLVPAFGTAAVILLSIAVLWSALWISWLRWLAILPLAAGIALAAMPERQDIFIDAEGKAAAVRGPDGKLSIIGARFASFAAKSWLSSDGDARNPKDPTLQAGVQCDRFGCTAPLSDGRRVALSWSYAALAEDCQRAAVIITRLRVSDQCRANALVIDGADLAQLGALTLRMNPEAEKGFAMTASHVQGSERSWYNRPPPPEELPKPIVIPITAEPSVTEPSIPSYPPEEISPSADGEERIEEAF